MNLICIFPLEKEEMKTEFNCRRKNSTRLKERAHAVTKDQQQKEITESRFQMLETTIKRLEEELSIEKSQKKELVENTARLNKMCDEMKEDIRIVKKILEERKEPIKTLSESSDNVLNESACEERTRCYSLQEEFIVLDRIPNALEREKSLERPENFRFPDTATSPEGLIEFKLEGKFAVDWCISWRFICDHQTNRSVPIGLNEISEVSLMGRCETCVPDQNGFQRQYNLSS